MANREFDDIHVHVIATGCSLFAAFAANLSSKHPTAARNEQDSEEEHHPTNQRLCSTLLLQFCTEQWTQNEVTTRPCVPAFLSGGRSQMEIVQRPEWG